MILFFILIILNLKNLDHKDKIKLFKLHLGLVNFFILKENLGITPIFFMDDVFGELDSYRAKKISNYLREIGQAFITMTDFSNLDKLNKSENDIEIM